MALDAFASDRSDGESRAPASPGDEREKSSRSHEPHTANGLGCPPLPGDRPMSMMQLLSDPHVWLAFLTLTALELVLGIDNIVFISILVDKLPEAQRNRARRIGLFLAMFMRIGLLSMLSFLVGLTAVLFTAFDHGFTGRDLILAAGGAFLLWKSTREVHQLLEGKGGEASSSVRATFGAVIVQIIIIDAVFSLDSIITAVGMVDELEIMVAAVIASVALMMAFSGAIARFVSTHPSIKMLALGFLFVIGVVLVADGFGHHIPKGYVYGAMAFALTIELLNIKMRKAAARPVDLRESYEPAAPATCSQCGAPVDAAGVAVIPPGLPVGGP
jgi:predicted tellurium resistance membrane protein TerC